MASERIEGPTPNGDYALAVWIDIDSWVEVPREDATGVIISEYNAVGEMVFETVGRLNGSQSDGK